MKFSEIKEGYHYRITRDFAVDGKLGARGATNLKGELVRIDRFNTVRGCFEWRLRSGNKANYWVRIEDLEPPDKNPK